MIIGIRFLVIFILSLSFYLEGVFSKIMNVQTLPVFAVISLLFIIILIPYLKLSTKLVIFILSLILYLFLISIISLILSNFSFIDLMLRVFTSIFFALSMFLFLSFIIKVFNDRELDIFIISGFLIVFILSIIEFFVYKKRVTAFSMFSEPSHLGYYISMIVIPFLILRKNRLNYKFFYLLLAFSLINLFLTFSATSFYALFLFLISLSLLSLSNLGLFLKNLFILLSLALVIYIVFFNIYPENYLNIMVTSTIKGIFYEQDVLFSYLYSFSDRFQFLFIFPHLVNGIDSAEQLFFFFFGYGVGSERTYFEKIFPTYLFFVSEIKAGSYLTSLQSKLLIYGGLTLFTLLNILWLKLFLKVRKINKILSSIILTVFLYSFSGLGALGLPILWFWMAFAFNYLNNKHHKSCSVQEH